MLLVKIANLKSVIGETVIYMSKMIMNKNISLTAKIQTVTGLG